jgi:hypothetical protein
LGRLLVSSHNIKEAKMGYLKNAELLKDERVKEEIGRHRWIESEKAGMDIGFDRAAEDWLNRFSDSWIRSNLNQKKTATRSARRF